MEVQLNKLGYICIAEHNAALTIMLQKTNDMRHFTDVLSGKNVNYKTVSM